MKRGDRNLFGVPFRFSNLGPVIVIALAGLALMPLAQSREDVILAPSQSKVLIRYLDTEAPVDCRDYALDQLGLKRFKPTKGATIQFDPKEFPLKVMLLRQQLPANRQLTEVADGESYHRAERDILIVHQGLSPRTQDRLADLAKQYNIRADNVIFQGDCATDAKSGDLFEPFTRMNPEKPEIQMTTEPAVVVFDLFVRQPFVPYPWARDFDLSQFSSGEDVLVVEKAQCAPDSNFLVASLSKVAELPTADAEPGKILVARQKMLGVTNHYGVSGEPLRRSIVERSIDPSHYWCIPKREFCYRNIEFGQFGVKLQAGEAGMVDTSKVYNLRLGLVSAFQKAFVEHCMRPVAVAARPNDANAATGEENDLEESGSHE